MKKELLHQGENCTIFKQWISESNTVVIHKILNQEFPSNKTIQQFYREYEVTKDLDITGIRKVLQKGKIENQHTIVLEHIDGVNLNEIAKQQPIAIDQFLDIAIKAASLLQELHQLNIIHRNINAFKFILNQEDGSLHLIDLGKSSQTNLKVQSFSNPNKLEQDLAYISPEQTGRMNRTVDYRTDMYSLGVTLYQLLTGTLPFSNLSPLELVHAHIATLPESASKRRTAVPEAIAEILSKLMAKNAEDRYKSVYGLLSDLKKCESQWEKEQAINPFELRQKDYSSKLEINQQLYGRDAVMNTLLGCFQKVSSSTLELVLVSGYSGTGKSALVHEVHRPISEKKGNFIEGKFDQYQKSIPYFAFKEALNGFINLALTEEEEKLAHIRENILAAVGAEGRVLTEVLPKLESIIGEQPAIPELGGLEGQNRFIFIFRKFISAVSSKEHPLVIFIDDLQWADSGSLRILKSLMTDKDKESKCLMIICAYRDNEVNSSHPFIATVKEIEEITQPATRLHLDNLTLADVHSLIADTTGMTKAQTKVLSQLVYDKTHGNAFFVVQFLKTLYTSRQLFFDFETLKWQWDIEKIKSQNITENVVELLAGNVLLLETAIQQTLKIAACIGNSFTIETLAIITKENEGLIGGHIEVALAKGFIIPLADKYKFIHDRVQQAVYSLISQKEQIANHYLIGKLLMEKDNEDDQNLFEIVNHLNLSVSLIKEAAEKTALSDLNYRAAKKAMASSAFSAALDFAKQGLHLLPEDAWKTHYENTLKLSTLAAEAAYNTATFDQMLLYINNVLEFGHSILDKISIYALKINAYKAENKLPEAIDVGLDVLQKLGEKIPKKGPLPLVMKDLLKTKFMLRGKKKEDILNLPEMQNQEKSAALRILNDIASPVYWSRPAILPFVIFRMVQLSLRYGITNISAFGFATYGLLMCGVLGDMPEGYRFGQIGLGLLNKFKSKEWLSQIYTPIYALINHWTEHIHKSLEPFLYSYTVGFETGAIEYACINVNIYCNHLFLGGMPLSKTASEMKVFSESMLTYKQETNYNYNQVYRQAVLNLQGSSEDVFILKGAAFDEIKMMEQNRERKDRAGDFLLHFSKTMINYLFGKYEEAKHHSEISRPLLDAVLAKYDVAVFHFYEALILLALAQKEDSSSRKKLIAKANKNIKQFKKWAKFSPDNHEHKYQLLSAEKFKVLGKYSEAKKSYEKAINGAHQKLFLNEEALACERAALFYEFIEDENLKNSHIKRAFQVYKEWGAKAKLNDLKENYYEVITSILQDQPSSKTAKNPSATDTDLSLDLQSVIKASTAISKEIVLERLLKKMMFILMENAGAQSGSILLIENDEWILKISGSMETKEAEWKNQPLTKATPLPHAIIQFVARSNEELVLEDVNKEYRFNSDSYIIEKQPKSIVCLPIMHQGKNIGLVYLENNILNAAFTQKRVKLLQLLSGQISVSIVNAQVYETLEEKVKERTRELIQKNKLVEEQKKELTSQYNIIENEKKHSDEILLNILPDEVLTEMKQNGSVESKQFERVSVLFTDFKDFTKISKKMTPKELVDEIHTCFKTFDQITEKYGIEKIKTIGDSYMCAEGLSTTKKSHPKDLIYAALEMKDFIQKRKLEKQKKGEEFFEVRIGVHTGPVVAGIVGTKKYAFDIWGATVNTASRIESACQEGRLNISENTYEVIKDDFDCTFRGKLDAKNIGEIAMYYVNCPLVEKPVEVPLTPV